MESRNSCKDTDHKYSETFSVSSLVPMKMYTISADKQRTRNGTMNTPANVNKQYVSEFPLLIVDGFLNKFNIFVAESTVQALRMNIYISR
ncbi:hypothetical protein TNCV_4342771 [Trichonephila clavipes]|nr:hypothetical protein TNCV_4342771 [Trichonephila clavipes]